MSTWFDKFRSAADSPEIVTYKRIRAAGKSWCSKIMAHPACKHFEIVKAAKKLTLSVEDRTIIFEDEAEQAVLMDYFLFDYCPDGKSLAESCVFTPGELTPIEAEFHQANLVSRTSLFEVTGVHDREPKILLRDRLTKDTPELWLTDVGLSETFRRMRQILLYTRVVNLKGLHFTGGFSFVFDLKHASALTDGYGRAMWSIPESRRAHRRTGFFLGLNRKIGMEQAYHDIEPPALDGPQ
jgi:hypothetical protein